MIKAELRQVLKIEYVVNSQKRILLTSTFLINLHKILIIKCLLND